MRVTGKAMIVAALLTAGCSAFHAAPLPGAQSAQSGAWPKVLQGGSGGQWIMFTPPGGGLPTGIAQGADDSVWFAELGFNGGQKSALVRVNNRGTFSRSIMLPDSAPAELVAGADGKFYLSDVFEPEIVVVDPRGGVVTLAIDRQAISLTRGPDGNVWFADGDDVGYVTPDGVVKSYPLSPIAFSEGITTGPDANIWFTDGRSDSVWMLQPATGAMTRYPLGPNDLACILPEDIVAAGDGYLYFTCLAGSIGKIDLHGHVIRFVSVPERLRGHMIPGPKPLQRPFFTTAHGIHHIFSDGTIAGNENPAVSPILIATMLDGNIWFSAQGNEIGVLVRQVMTVSPASLELSNVGVTAPISVSEVYYHGTYWASTSNASVATPGPVADGMVTVTAVGSGSCTITVHDGIGNSVDVAVTVL